MKTFSLIITLFAVFLLCHKQCGYCHSLQIHDDEATPEMSEFVFNLCLFTFAVLRRFQHLFWKYLGGRSS